MGGYAYSGLATEAMADLGSSSKMNAEWDFLHAAGKRAPQRAEEFFNHGADLGKRSSLYLDALLEGT